jgi:hypothetical protein
MKTSKIIIFYCLPVLCSLLLFGCGKKADENKPLSEVRAEAEKMNAEKLRSMAMDYKEAVLGKKAELEKLAGQLKDIPVAKMLGDEAKGLKAEIEALNKSVSALTERFQVYYNKLKEKGGDLAGLEL